MNPNALPRRVTPHDGPWPLHDVQSSRTAEQQALAGQPAHALMERAGLAVARLALALAPHATALHVWAGPGNNGGDGLVAARHLHALGKRVEVTLLGDATRRPADAAAALRRAIDAGVAITPEPPATRPDWTIDALLGLGASRAPEGDIAEAIARINSDGAPVLAVDLPSGLHADTGMPLGAQAVRAIATLSLLTLKPGCHTGIGRDHAGQTWLATLGVAAGDPTAWLNGPPAAIDRRHASHKGSFGDVAVVGGARGMTGAAWLAARAASAAGAGRVYCSLLDKAAPLLDPQHPELMGRAAWWLGPPESLESTTVACGCGGGNAVREVLPALLSQVRRLVLDADALNAVAADAELRTLLRSRAGRGLMTLLTPHPLEAARLLGVAAAEVQHDRIAAARVLADDCGAAVLLKGSGSVIAGQQQSSRINPTGNAALASAGSGDVLAGWAAGLWAQDAAAHPADVAAAAAWVHGEAADRWLAQGHRGPLRASVLVEVLAQRPAG